VVLEEEGFSESGFFAQEKPQAKTTAKDIIKYTIRRDMMLPPYSNGIIYSARSMV
jgi:hypothetical protein